MYNRPEMNPYIDLSVAQWLIVAVGGIVIGLSRTAIRGAAFVVIPVFAELFGGKLSTAMVLLMLITGDFVAIRYYFRNADWKLIGRLTPWMLVGVLTGVLVGRFIDDRTFTVLIVLMVLASVGILFWREFRPGERSVPHYWWFSASLGLAGGFSSMVGNAAGPVMNLYFLSMGLDKKDFIGTTAWFFFMMNVIKVPFHAFVWHTISGGMLVFAAIMAVPVLLGTVLGIWVARIIPERPFRIGMMVLVTVASARLLFV